MAAPQRIFALSLGSQVVRMAEFTSAKSGSLTLTGYSTSELIADPATDGTRVGQVGLAVKELVEKLKAGGMVNYAIPAQSVFTRFVKLPSVGSEKIDQIVGFEAQQNVPFPINEVIWDYQVVESSEADKTEVVLVAIKADLLDDLNDAVEANKVRTGVVDVAPMAIYNAFRHGYSDIAGCSLIVDIGSRTTNLIFVEGDRIFVRSILIGGNTITAAVAKDFDEPFLAAEERKKACGFVSLGGAYADHEDPEVARVSKIARTTLTRLHTEIVRSVSFYRSQQGGSAPERIYLSGAGSSMQYMAEFFTEKLNLPVEYFNPLRNVTVGGKVDAQAIGNEAYLMGELVGLALRSAGQCRMTVNLLPESVRAAQDLAKRKPALIGAAACVLGAIGACWFYYSSAATFVEQKTAELQPKVQQLSDFSTKMANQRKENEGTKAIIAPLVKALEEREYWVKLIEDLNTRLPDRNIWITNLSIGSPAAARTAGGRPAAGRAPAARPAAPATGAPPAGPVLIVKGLYLSNPAKAGVIDGYLKNLSESPYLDIDLSKINEIAPVRTTQNDHEWTFEYVLNLPLKSTILP